VNDTNKSPELFLGNPWATAHYQANAIWLLPRCLPAEKNAPSHQAKPRFEILRGFHYHAIRVNRPLKGCFSNRQPPAARNAL